MKLAMFFQNLINVFNSQSKVGIVICFIISGVFISYIIMSIETSRFYKILNREIEKKKKSKVYKFKNKVVVNIYKEFQKAMQSGIENVNTQVIVLENIPKRQKLEEHLLNYFVSVVIILGLLGTFIGLTGSIMNIKSVLSSVQGKTGNMDTFMVKMSSPLASMSTAFITSIFGITSSIVLNSVGLLTFKTNRTQFYDSIENYLDNYEAANNSRNNFKLLTNFTENVQYTMQNMTDRIANVFDQGIMNISDKINFVSVDLSQSAKVLEDVIGKLDMSISTFNRPIFEFKKSVDEFKNHYNGFDSGIKKIDDIVCKLSKSLENTVNSFEGNRNAVKEVSTELHKSSKNISKAYEKLMVMIDRIQQENYNNSVGLESKMKEMGKIYKELLKSMTNFNANTKMMTKNVAYILKEEFKEEVDNVNYNIVKMLSRPIGDIKVISKSMETQMYLLGKTLNSYERLLQDIKHQRRSF